MLPVAPAQQAAVPAISLEIPRPPELQRDVDFWIRVYSEITTLQGQNHIWFCGAYQRYGFHEDGLLSAVTMAGKMGIDPPW